MPRWKRNLIIAGIIALFIYIPATMFHFIGYAWHQLFHVLHTIKKENHWR